jgi:hypothetical protein
MARSEKITNVIVMALAGAGLLFGFLYAVLHSMA